MVQDQDCNVGETHVQYGFQWSNAQWPLKSGVGNSPIEVEVDEYVDFTPGENFHNHRCQDTTNKVLRIKTVLWSHQINHMKAIYSPNNGGHNFLCRFAVSLFLMHLRKRGSISRGARDYSEWTHSDF
jgi:hypothetical protein